jgi:hypothetical protein
MGARGTGVTLGGGAAVGGLATARVFPVVLLRFFVLAIGEVVLLNSPATGEGEGCLPPERRLSRQELCLSGKQVCLVTSLLFDDIGRGSGQKRLI